MKKFLILSMLLFIFCGEDASEVTPIEATIETTEEIEMTYDKTYSAPPAMNINENGNYSAIIETSLGSIEIELFTDIAPITVNNFVNLSNLSSITSTIPIFGSIVQKGKLAASAFFDAVSALNKVDFPTFGSPTIPHLNPI